MTIVEGAETLCDMREQMMRGHVERLAPMVAEALAAARLEPADLDGLAVTTGPGSFTGARLGVSFARGMALALDIPVVGLSVFEMIAATVDCDPLAVALDGKRDTLFVQVFDKGAPQGVPQELRIEAAWRTAPDGKVGIAGSGAAALIEHAPPEDRKRFEAVPFDPAFSVPVATLGARRIELGDLTLPAPLYLRAPDAKPQASVAFS